VDKKLGEWHIQVKIFPPMGGHMYLTLKNPKKSTKNQKKKILHTVTA
jgi:hypothetical protein